MHINDTRQDSGPTCGQKVGSFAVVAGRSVVGRLNRQRSKPRRQKKLEKTDQNAVNDCEAEGDLATDRTENRG